MKNSQATVKVAVLSIFLVVVIGWLGSPWRMHDEPTCSDEKSFQACGGKAFWHQSLRGFIYGAHFHLIKTVVGSSPVMLNMVVKNPQGCDVGLTTGDLYGALFADDAFKRRHDEGACPVFEGNGDER